MSLTYTTEQILGLAPNQVHIRTSRGLALTEKWTDLARNRNAAWGKFTLKNKPSLQTTIRLPHLAFSCTCNNRVYPCTHALALLLLLSADPATFTQKRSPTWVRQWLNAESPPLLSGYEGIASATEDEHIIQRQATIIAGLQELKRWLHDMVRGGFVVARDRPKSYWTAMAHRLVDARAGEVAWEVQQMATLIGNGQDWPQQLLAAIGRLYLLIQGFERFDTLTPAEQADLRAATGWFPRLQDGSQGDSDNDRVDCQQSPIIHDRWHVLGRRLDSAGKRKLQHLWLWGESGQRPALIARLIHSKQAIDTRLLCGTVLTGDLHFYPSRTPLRAQIVAYKTIDQPQTRITANPSVADVIRTYGQAMAVNPWLRAYPVALHGVAAQRDGEQWLLQDKAGYVLPLPKKFEHGWHLASLGRAGNLALFGEWDGVELKPLSVWTPDRFIELQVIRGIK